MQKICLLALVAALLVACGGQPDKNTPLPGGLKDVPRNRTLIMDCIEPNTCAGQIVDYDAFNPFVPGGISRIGYNFLYEPLFFFNAYQENAQPIPWIGESFRFNADYTQVEIQIRRGVKWSDGHPWTARDLVFTINMLKANAPDLLYSTEMVTWVKEAVAVDDYLARIVLTSPNPRFLYNYFIHSGDQGLPIVPAHIWEGQDPKVFANFDMSKGWPVITGPYQLALSEPAQRIWDLRPDWWAAQLGFHPLPQVERLVYLPYMDEAKRVQNLIANNLDTSAELRPSNITSVLEQNPQVTTWTGRQPPYSYITWWPISLGFNDLEEPFSDPEIRRAIAYAIDREQLVEIGWQKSGDWSVLPLPDVPQMKKYFAPGLELAARHEVGVFDLEKSAQILRRKGWTREGKGFWQKEGKPLTLVIDIFSHFQDLTPVLVAQLKKAGFDASFRMTSDYSTRLAQGTARAFLFGNFSSLRDPYFVLSHYHSRFMRPTGEPADQYWRWKNPRFDALIDRMGQVPEESPEMMELYQQLMDIWLGELPSIPLVQWPHRIAHNQTYWTNWPSAENPYINSAYWSRTWLLVLLNLKPAQG